MGPGLRRAFAGTTKKDDRAIVQGDDIQYLLAVAWINALDESRYEFA
jgi:hypothetical protein